MCCLTPEHDIEDSLFADEFWEWEVSRTPYLAEEGESGDEFRLMIEVQKRKDRYGLSDAEALELLKEAFNGGRLSDGWTILYWKISGEDVSHKYVYTFSPEERMLTESERAEIENWNARREDWWDEDWSHII